MGFSFKYTRYSAIAQITLGVLSIVFGIADRALIVYRYTFHTVSVVPIWMGVWFVITGVIGVYGSNRSYATNGVASRPLMGTYLAFSIVSIVFAGVIIIIYGIGVGLLGGSYSCREYTWYNPRTREYVKHPIDKKCQTGVALGSMVIIFAILEFFIGIWASVCACTSGCCDCCNPPAQQTPQLGQVIYLQTPHGPQAYVMTQGANAVPVAVPAVVPGQVQMPAATAPQAMYPSPAGAQGGGAQGGGAQGGGGNDAQAPPLQTKSNLDMPPVYQP